MKRLLAVAACALLAFACTTPPGEVVPTPDASVEPPVDASVEPPVDASVEPPDASVEAPDAGLEPDAGVELPPPPVTGEASVEFVPADAARLSEVRAVVFRLALTNAAGKLPVALELTAPSGLPFQRMVREVRGEPGQPLTVEYTLPVAGTLVHNARMHGEWIGTFDTKGQALDTIRFELQP